MTGWQTYELIINKFKIEYSGLEGNSEKKCVECRWVLLMRHHKIQSFFTSNGLSMKTRSMQKYKTDI